MKDKGIHDLLYLFFIERTRTFRWDVEKRIDEFEKVRLYIENLETENEKLKLMIANKKDMQEQSNGIILACSEFISDMAVSSSQVCTVLSVTGITREEWNACEDEYSKNKILDKLGGEMRWLND